ncbi:MAG: prenyltransferase/squalene oxidase repeat-containing protein, partial [Thermoanaerobaculia bacterium]
LFSRVYDNDAGFDVDERRPMYGHAFSMMFLAQVLGGEESLERQEEIRAALRQAVDLTIRAQSDRGGWYYYPRTQSDEGTLTVTMMQGLRACKDAGIHVPREVIEQGIRYIEASVNPDGGVRYRSTRTNAVREGVTCASVVALWSAGRYENDPLLRKIRDYMDRNIRAQWNAYEEDHGTYIQFYLSQARFLLGGSRWRDYYRTESRLLVGDQEANGSWLTLEERSRHGVGEVYSTSIALIVLQLPYNRLPVFQR